MKLAIVASHPVQYHAPLFRTLAGQLDLTVFSVHRDSREDHARAGFAVCFAWDIDQRARDPASHGQVNPQAYGPHTASASLMQFASAFERAML